MTEKIKKKAKNADTMEKENVLIVLSVLFISILLFLFNTTITGYATLPVDYKNLCRADNDCRVGQCCLVYVQDNIGLCMRSCQDIQFICSSDSECEQGVCCKSEGSFGICKESASQCLDSPMLNKEAYARLNKISPALESPSPLTYLEYKNKYLIAALIELVLIIVLVLLLVKLLLEKRVKRKAIKNPEKISEKSNIYK